MGNWQQDIHDLQKITLKNMKVKNQVRDEFHQNVDIVQKQNLYKNIIETNFLYVKKGNIKMK